MAKVFRSGEASEPMAKLKITVRGTGIKSSV